MATITKSKFQLCCIGCGKPLNHWNQHVYHNSKCRDKWVDKIDNIMEVSNMAKKVKGGKGGKKTGY